MNDDPGRVPQEAGPLAGEISFDPELFKKNLAACLRAYPNNAAHLKELAAPSAQLEIHATRTDAPGLRLDGRQLTSKFDPETEAEREIKRVLANNSGRVPKTLCLLGSPGGYLSLAALRAGCRDVHVFEPDPSVLAATLGMRDFTREITEQGLRFACRIEQVFFTIDYKVRLEPDVALAISPTYPKAFPGALETLTERIHVLIRNTNLITQTVLLKQRAWFDYTVKNFIPFARSPGIEKVFDKFRGVPAVVVSAGPSLDKNVAHLSAYRDRVMIFAVGTALRKLKQIGVVPDVAVVLESNDIRSQFVDLPYLPEIFLALDIETFPDLWKLPVRGFFGFSGASKNTHWFVDQLKRGRGKIPVGGSVANAAFSIAAHFGADPIILTGQDLAFSPSGAMHAGGIGVMGKDDLKSDALATSRSESELAQEGIFLVDGYYGGKVMTRVNLRNYLLWFEQSTPALTSTGRRAINCTEGGARIQGFEQLPLKDVLSSLRPLGFDVKERLASFRSDETIDREEILGTLEDIIGTARRVHNISRRLTNAIRDTLPNNQGSGVHNSKVARTLRLADKSDAEIAPLVKKIDPLLTPLCNKAILLTEKAYDYEGLTEEQQRRMNLQQTHTMHAGLVEGAEHLIETLERLRDEIDGDESGVFK